MSNSDQDTVTFTKSIYDYRSDIEQLIRDYCTTINIDRMDFTYDEIEEAFKKALEFMKEKY